MRDELGVCTTHKKIVFSYENGLGLRPVETTTYRGRKTALRRACIPPSTETPREYLLTFTDGFSAGDVEIDGAFGFARHFGCGGGEAFGLLRGLSLSARVGILLGGKSLPTQLLPTILQPVVH